MTVNQFRTGQDSSAYPGESNATLIERLSPGTPFAVSFSGQGTNWLPMLAELAVDADLENSLARIVDAAHRLVAPVADHIAAAQPEEFEPLKWVGCLAADESVPSDVALRSAALSVPGILLTQLAAVESLAKQGLELRETRPCTVIAHSQGVLACDRFGSGASPGDGALLALAHLIGAAGSVVSRRVGLIASAAGSPMMSVSKVTVRQIEQIVDDYRCELVGESPLGAPVVAIINGRRSVVLSGAPRHLRAIVDRCEVIANAEADARAKKQVGGAPFAPVFDELPVAIGFHHPDLSAAVDLVVEWAGECGLDQQWARERAAAILSEPGDWVAAVDGVVADGAQWILDLGPSDAATRLSAPLVRGTGVGLVPAALRGGQRNIFAPGGIPAVSEPWSSYAPTLVTLPDGRTVVDTAFTRLTGRSPMLLAGMTPTTVDPAIVAAAANAGHWAELAGGGQVTESILAENLDRLGQLLEPGRQAQFNALFLDPYLWKLQVGGKRLVQRARAAGAPLDGVVISAGLPELDDAVAIVSELIEAGLPYVAFKPGTVEQIRSVIRIAAEVPQHPVIVHVEGGRAGGHHSWEDLDDLLLSTYAELRSRSNVVLCVGGGIGTPERAADYLTGQWAHRHAHPTMPVDGILLGTVAMATAEATTSPAVKQLLVDTPGCDDWIGAGYTNQGMSSGRSQLGADIHEIDNAASACGRLLDEVAGDAEAVADRRDEIVSALDATAKPYFGDVETMTYHRWLTRYADLAVGEDGEYPWADITWRTRFVQMLQRAEGRLHNADRGEIAATFADEMSVDNAHAAIAALIAIYPAAEVDILHPADVAYFLDLCRIPGKPVNFVPVVDADVRRWWRSDSLWQAHDARYSADEVCVIPGPLAVGGITRVNEPVGELFNNFEAFVANALADGGAVSQPVSARRRSEATSVGELAVVINSESVQWAGRMVTNPIAALGDINAWSLVGGSDGRAEHAPTGSVLISTEGGAQLIVDIAGVPVRIDMAVDASIADGGAPRVTVNAASDAMRGILAVAAGGTLPDVNDGVAQTVTRFSANDAADHAGVTAHTLPAHMTANIPTGQRGWAIPDALVGASWPAVFAVIGAARTDDGSPVIEGLLDLVHLDHAVRTVGTLPSADTSVSITASNASVTATEVGTVVTVEVIFTAHGDDIACLTERFAIRGRPGSASLTDPVRAGAASIDERAANRALMRSASVTAPARMNGFAAISGDRNPIHTDANAARLAGLGEPIVHGMWLSAAAQHVVTAVDAEHPLSTPRALLGWTARFLGMVRTRDVVDIRVDRVGLDNGAEVVEVTCAVAGELVMAASGRLSAPKTVYAFPGQGIQSQGMGLDARSRSAAAREVWERADAHTRAALGFSIISVVADNPTTLVARGTTYSHPDGVLFLTQFTQVAMATLGVAQIAELTEAGGFVPGALTCGHSVGEYNALAACAGVLPLEAVVEVVFQRGEAMHHLVPRDELGRSNYRLAAIRPSQCGVADDDVVDFIADVARACGEFLEVVNLNLRGSQYAIAGTVRGLENLETEIDTRRARVGGRRAFILVPGIDVPFHSTVLRDGVPEFRQRLHDLLPQTIDPDVLIGRYIPNLVPTPFTLSREFVTEIAELVPSEPLADVLADFDAASSDRAGLARTILIELLAWQFASPVRWIETQDLLFTDTDHGGLGVDRFVEVGLAGAPTLSGLATNTLKLDGFDAAAVQVLNLQRDSDVVLSQDVGIVEDNEEDLNTSDTSEHQPVEQPVSAQPVSAPAAPISGSTERPADIAFEPADAVRSVIALWTKMRTDQIGVADTIEALCDGVSSRRNQLLLDVGTELALGAIDGAAEADMTALATTVNALARGYRPFGPVLTDAIADQMRKVVGPVNKRASYVGDRVSSVWQLGAGWSQHVCVALALGSRDGASVRGGDLGGLAPSLPSSVSELDAMIDAAVTTVAQAHSVTVSLPSSDGDAGATVDAGALADLTEQFVGRSGALATAARTVLAKLGLDTPAVHDTDSESEAQAQLLAQRVSAELGSDWLRMVTPTFDEKATVLIDDRWATAREDLVRIWTMDECTIDRDFDTLTEKFAAAGATVAAHATWWQGKALYEGAQVRARAFAQIAERAEDPSTGVFADDVAVVTGASSGSIAAAVVGKLLAGGATVVATTSRLDSQRLSFFKKLYRDNARSGAALWIASTNMYSYSDIDDLIDWVVGEQVSTAGGSTTVIKPSLTPTLLFPFAAPRVAGDLTEAGTRAELEMKVLLWSVERLIAGLGSHATEHNLDARMHVVLPGSPNRGTFGGDGAYGESKAALDAVINRWKVEESWNAHTTVAHAIIGWVRGTGLMGHNDGIVEAVEAAGVRTWTTDEMAVELIGLCSSASRQQARTTPLVADLTAGLGNANIDLADLARRASDAAAPADNDGEVQAIADAVIPALPAPARASAALTPEWPELSVDPADLVVIVGAGELGPYGSSRTRFEMEVADELSAAGVMELAWSTGLITWESTPKPGWYDVTSGDPVAENEIADRYHDVVVERCGIRQFADDGALIDQSSPLLESIFLDEDLTFTVSSEADAHAFVAADPAKTRVVHDGESGEWQVTRMAGTEIRVPRRFALSRTVGGQIPTGFDPTRWGISADMVESVDRVALWNLVSTVDAFLSSGFEPADLMRWVHPSAVANTQGTGMGGMTSMRSLYIDTILGESKANDILQEALPNVIAAHVVQSYVGSYGAMIHPVAACATAAVSVEEGVDKIRVGKASFVVAGGFDDLSIEGIVGFGDMSATADSAAMAAKGIDSRRYSRANDRRRGGFVESQGGGTVLLARGDVAADMGLPVLGVVAWAQSFGDGVHTSIPAPGIGALGAGQGGRRSPMAASLESLGVSADDIAVISKHDTSTAANDPNEADLHERLAMALGRGDGAPLFVVSQKSLTGHAKGGAAAFQLIGLCQMLSAGVIPPNRSLDCVDEVMAKHEHLVWVTDTLNLGTRFPMKAGLLTSLGFGHVSGLIAVVHPEAFIASLSPKRREAYRERATHRSRAGAQRRLQAMCGGEPLYRKPANRRFGEGSDYADREAAMLLDHEVRLDDNGEYRAGVRQ